MRPVSPRAFFPIWRRWNLFNISLQQNMVKRSESTYYIHSIPFKAVGGINFISVLIPWWREIAMSDCERCGLFWLYFSKNESPAVYVHIYVMWKRNWMVRNWNVVCSWKMKNTIGEYAEPSTHNHHIQLIEWNEIRNLSVFCRANSWVEWGNDSASFSLYSDLRKILKTK